MEIHLCNRMKSDNFFSIPLRIKVRFSIEGTKSHRVVALWEKKKKNYLMFLSWLVV